MISKENDNNTTTANNNKIMYVPAELVLLIATQKSCKGLGSQAEAREDAKAKRATVTR